jgi:hypothetical protein
MEVPMSDRHHEYSTHFLPHTPWGLRLLAGTVRTVV